MRTLVVLLILLALFWLLQPQQTHAQGAPADSLDDPVVKGAWLYAGNCMRCHGAYAEERLGKDKTSKELKAQISGEDRQGCKIDWGVARGGTLLVRDIIALVAYIEAWEADGREPDLPPLPPQPTRTPTPLPAVADGATPALTATPAPTPLAPELAQALASNPIARGAWLYAQHCQRCHQDYATGRMGRGLDDERIERTIQNGKTGSNMPAFAVMQGGPLRSTDIKAILNYVAAWEHFGASPALPDVVKTAMVQELDPAMLLPIALPALSPVRGDAQRGAQLYRTYCLPCHGVTGAGGVGPVLARVWEGVRPDLTLRATIAQGVPASLMRAWAQEQGGPLDSAAVDDLVTYLSSLAPTATGGPPARQPAQPLVAIWLDLLAIFALLIGIGIGSAGAMAKLLCSDSTVSTVCSAKGSENGQKAHEAAQKSED